MPQVRLERSLRVPADPAAQALSELLHAIAAQEGPWRGFALHVSLGDLHLPDVGYVAVPIDLRVTKDPREPRAFDIGFTASNMPAAFPSFAGRIALRPGDLGECSLAFTGSYELPLHLLGRLLDATLTPHIAARSLENFVDEIAAACMARVDQREAEFVRYHYYGQTPR